MLQAARQAKRHNQYTQTVVHNIMKKMKILILIAFLTGVNSFAQDLKCSDFKVGTFYIPSDEELDVSFLIKRNGNTQVEYLNHNEDNDGYYETLEWIDDCTYRMKYDESKMILNDIQKDRNSRNGILIEKVKIEGNCMIYKATGDVNGEMMEMFGKICKQTSD
ncbi:hypothetical protein GCM10008083_34270 [Ulvibacter litoralis]|nr:hypothetical protein GCM10008083_34270 [Ulvibacter litoralis]